MPPEVEADEVEEVETQSPEDSELPDPPGAEEQPEVEEAQAQPASPWESFRGVPAFQGKSDEEIAAGLYQTLQREQQLQHQLRQFQSIVPVASEYLTNRELYEQWKNNRGAPAQQPAPQQAAAPAEESWWNPPKLRDAYKQYLTRDEQGREIISPDAPLDARHALTEYQAYRADFAKKFLENPEETLMPMVARVAEQRAQGLIQEQLHRRDEENFVQQIETENADWLRDENGGVSREALLAQKYVEEAKQYGLNGARPRWEFARRMVERDLLLAYYQMREQASPQAAPAVPQQQPQQESVDQRNMEYLRQQAMRTPARGSVGTTDSRVPPKQALTFTEKLKQNLGSAGMLGNS